MIRVRGKGFLLIRNNAPSHISNKTTEFIKNIKIKECKDWPSYNPDLNQNWKYLGNNQITANEEGNKQKIRINLRNKSAYDSISNEVISKLIESFPNRLQQWIKNEGERIPY